MTTWTNQTNKIKEVMMTSMIILVWNERDMEEEWGADTDMR